MLTEAGKGPRTPSALERPDVVVAGAPGTAAASVGTALPRSAPRSIRARALLLGLKFRAAAFTNRAPEVGDDRT